MNVVNPWTFTRRTGAACDTAHISAEVSQSCWPATLIVMFSSERQKFTSATQLPGPRHRLWTLTSPFSVTSVGEAPSPATCV